MAILIPKKRGIARLANISEDNLESTASTSGYSNTGTSLTKRSNRKKALYFMLPGIYSNVVGIRKEFKETEESNEEYWEFDDREEVKYFFQHQYWKSRSMIHLGFINPNIKNQPQSLSTLERKVRANANATCLLYYPNDIEGKNRNRLSNRRFPFPTDNDDRYELSPDERFINQFSIGIGTGFLISPSYILTTKHSLPLKVDGSIDEEKLTAPYGVKANFGYEIGVDVDDVSTFRFEEFSIRKVIGEPKNNKEDWAILEITGRSTTSKLGITPVSLNKKYSPQKGAQLYMIGHPLGLPKKITPNGQIIHPGNLRRRRFITTLDAYAGNSGAPVFSCDKHEVVGFLVGGEADFELNRDTGLLRSRAYTLYELMNQIVNGESCHMLNKINWPK